MATTTLQYQHSILLTLLVFHGFLLITTECRQLRSINPPPPPAAAAALSDTSAADDFRPTAPGVSPGVGHPKSDEEDFRSGVGNAQTGTSNAPNAYDSNGKDDFRPTAPGFSPGVGHAVGLQNRAPFSDETGELMATEIYNNDDFRPTAPGFSPGVGHAADVDAFRPTKPGQSPGVGHTSGEAQDFKPTQPGHSPGVGHAFVLVSSDDRNNKDVRYTISRGARDFKPTQPGHSPGVGHKN